MRKCWDRDPDQRPTFQEIVTVLRELSMKNPAYNMSTGASSRLTAPSGKVYLVHTVCYYKLIIIHMKDQ